MNAPTFADLAADLAFETIDEAAEYLLESIRADYPHLREFARRYDNPAAPDHLRIYAVHDAASANGNEIDSIQTQASTLSVDILAETDFWVSLVLCDAEYSLQPA
jgi:hypothetical protein